MSRSPIPSAPVPNTVLLQYMLTVAVGLLLWVSDNDERWAEFKAPFRSVMVDPDRKTARTILAVTIPALVAFATYGQVRPSVQAPPSFRAIHPANPSTITFRGRTIELAGLENPLREDGNLEEHYEEGKRIYYQNCLACHGDALRGRGAINLQAHAGPLGEAGEDLGEGNVLGDQVQAVGCTDRDVHRGRAGIRLEGALLGREGAPLEADRPGHRRQDRQDHRH